MVSGAEDEYLDEQNICSGFSERESHCLTNSPRASGYKSRLPLQGEQLLDRERSCCHCVCVLVSWCMKVVVKLQASIKRHKNLNGAHSVKTSRHKQPEHNASTDKDGLARGRPSSAFEP